MTLTPNPQIGAWIGDDSAELISLAPGQLAGFPLGVLTLGDNDTVFGSTDSELINGNQGEDELSGSAGDDTLFGGQGNDVLDGQAGNDVQLGNLGADLIRGGQGNDNLLGGGDNDVLFGDFGNDFLSGDLGIDVLTGGEGADTFALPLRGIDTDFISDFQDGVDLMLLPTGISFNDLQIQLRGTTQTVLSFAGQELAVINNILPDAITAADFVAQNTGTDNNGIDNPGTGDPERDNGIIVRLDQGFLYAPNFTDPIRIMPLGDSITQGQINRDLPEEEREGYRIGLSNRLTDFGLAFDLVGSQSNGTTNLPDRDHEGHPGFTTVQISQGRDNRPGSGIENWIPAANPELITLIAGTNNSGNPPENMLSQLDELLNRIFNQVGFDGTLLVGTIPPIDPSGRFEERIPNVEAYNAQIPEVVNKFAQQGNNVVFVDMINVPNGLTVEDITAPPDDSGIHPTAEGYEKIAGFWFDAILGQVGSVEALPDPNNGTGTNFNDVIVGNGANNAIEGRTGSDTLSGGGGADLFAYPTLNDGSDIILDFNALEGDIFGISATGFGGGLVAGASLSSAASATGTLVSNINPTPVGNSGNFLYNTASGLLSFDPDGVGSQPALQLATLTGIPQLSVNQFLIA